MSRPAAFSTTWRSWKSRKAVRCPARGVRGDNTVAGITERVVGTVCATREVPPARGRAKVRVGVARAAMGPAAAGDSRPGEERAFLRPAVALASQSSITLGGSSTAAWR
ncbi:MAG: hypothetical protein N2B05_11875, partial [Gemmatimonadales bacterium]